MGFPQLVALQMPSFLTLAGGVTVLKTMVLVGVGVTFVKGFCGLTVPAENVPGLDGPEEADDLGGVPAVKEPFCEPAPFALNHREVVEDRTFEFTPDLDLVLNDVIW